MLPKSSTGKAITCFVKNHVALRRYADDPSLRIDYNRSERAKRQVAVGRKSWLVTWKLGDPAANMASGSSWACHFVVRSCHARIRRSAWRSCSQDCGSSRSSDISHPHPVNPRLFWCVAEALTCDACKGPRKIVAFITQPSVIRKILEHCGLAKDDVVLKPARFPPGCEEEFFA